MDKKHIVCPHCDATNRIPSTRLGDNPKCGKCKQVLYTGEPINLTAANFNQHIVNSDVPVVVDFWASWCGPCQTMAPAFTQVTQQLEPNYRFAKVDTEAQQILGTQYGIRSIPTIAIFKNGQEIGRQAGAMGVEDIKRWIQLQG